MAAESACVSGSALHSEDQFEKFTPSPVLSKNNMEYLVMVASHDNGNRLKTHCTGMMTADCQS